MSNRTGGEIVIILALFFGALTLWVSKAFGLEFITGMQLVVGHIAFIALLVAAIYSVKKLSFRWVLILPISVVTYLLCWVPALDYWASKDIGHIVLGDSIWYANGWIQAAIVFSILVGGYSLIYFFSYDKDHWLFD